MNSANEMTKAETMKAAPEQGTIESLVAAARANLAAYRADGEPRAIRFGEGMLADLLAVAKAMGKGDL